MFGDQRHWRWRWFAAVVAVAALTAAIVIARLGLSLDSRSPLLWGAALVAVAVAVVLARFTFLDDERFDRGVSRMVGLRSELIGLEVRAAFRRSGLVLLFVAVAVASVHLVVAFQTPDAPDDDDQAAYLATAHEIHQLGLSAFVSDLYAGEFDEANRHPLYLLLLALRPTEGFGRALSCGFGIGAAVVAAIWSYRRYGPLTAGIAAVLLASNSSWGFHSTRVYAESLLMLCSLGAWAAAARLIDGETSSASNESEAPRIGSALALITGSLLALAWLAKGTGLLLLAGALAAVLFAAARQSSMAGWRRGSARCILIVTAFLLVGSPLLIRNLRRYGSPFYNVNSQLLFVDEYADPAALAAQQTTGEAACDYWETHTVGQMLWREAHGCVWETYILLRSLGPAPLDDGRILFGLPLGLLALLGVLSSPRFPGGLTGVWTLLLWLMFAWYVPIAAGERFLIPVLIPLLLAAAVGMARLLVLLFPHCASDPESGAC